MNMRTAQHTCVWLFVTVIIACWVAEASAQQIDRRGINSIGPRTSYPRIPYRAPLTGMPNNRGNYGGNLGGSYNSGGPLSFDLGAFMSGYATTPGQVIYYVDPTSGTIMNEGAAMDAGYGMEGLGMQEGTSTSGPRPNIRPRINVSAPDAMQTSAVLQRMRQLAIERILKSPERPFSAEWFTAKANVKTIPTVQNSAWATSNWKDVQGWSAITAEPLRFDYRTDSRGLISIYCNETTQGRAVDARDTATQLASSAPPAASEAPGLSLGVFAAVPPTLKPATTLFHLVLDKNGLVSGISVDLASGDATPLRGTADAASQRVAWQVDDDVVEAGLANLTEDVARALVFRANGWTQSWILMRIQENQLVPTPPAK